MAPADSIVITLCVWPHDTATATVMDVHGCYDRWTLGPQACGWQQATIAEIRMLWLATTQRRVKAVVHLLQLLSRLFVVRQFADRRPLANHVKLRSTV
jgi:hypothetical protein